MDVRFALLCRLVAKAHLRRTDGGAFRLEDFMAVDHMWAYDRAAAERAAPARRPAGMTPQQALALQIRATVSPRAAGGRS